MTAIPTKITATAIHRFRRSDPAGTSGSVTAAISPSDARSNTRSTTIVVSTCVRRSPVSRESAAMRAISPSRAGSTLFANSPRTSAQNVAMKPGRSGIGNIARQRSTRNTTPAPSAANAGTRYQ